MALQPVNRRSVPEDVFEQIVAEVLSGDMQPGEALPSERRLAEVLGVSRPAVREALKRLTAAGLVEVRQGDATTVRDFRRHAGLDLLPRLLIRAGELDVAVVRSILETRLHNGPKVAELAARRRPPELAALLDASIEALAAEAGSRRAAAPCPDLLGPRRRRRRLDRISVDVQHPSRHLRARTARAGRHDGRRGRPARGLPRTRRRDPLEAMPTAQNAPHVSCSNPPPPRCSPRSTTLEDGNDDHRATHAAAFDHSRGRAAREFSRHPSPWMIGATLVAALAARIAVGDWQLTDALVPLAMLAVFPFFEWMVHVFVLHWRPRQSRPR